MKNYLLAAGFLTLSLTACKQSETKVLTSENPDGSVTTTTVETEKTTGVDSAKINAAWIRQKKN
jgi:hypothetical protein